MSDNKSNKSADETSTVEESLKPNQVEHEKEIGGKAGPEPTRYGDWEGTKGGIISDF